MEQVNDNVDYLNENDITILKNLLRDKDAKISNYESDLSNRDKDIISLKEEIDKRIIALDNYQVRLEENNDLLQEKNQEIEKLKQAQTEESDFAFSYVLDYFKDLPDCSKSLVYMLQNKENAALKEQVKEYENMIASFSKMQSTFCENIIPSLENLIEEVSKSINEVPQPIEEEITEEQPSTLQVESTVPNQQKDIEKIPNAIIEGKYLTLKIYDNREATLSDNKYNNKFNFTELLFILCCFTNMPLRKMEEQLRNLINYEPVLMGGKCVRLKEKPNTDNSIGYELENLEKEVYNNFIKNQSQTDENVG